MDAPVMFSSTYVMEFFNTVRVPLSAAERGVMTEKTYDYTIRQVVSP